MNPLLRALSLLLAIGMTSCGGGGGGSSSSPPVIDTAPTANFAFACADLSCTFTSTSTNQVVGDAITVYSWTFGDSTSAVATANPSHVFASAGTYDVTLKVTDRVGASGTVVRKVAVSAPPTPAAPHASFTVACVSLDCTFNDTTSYDAGSVFASRLWDFGDGATLPAASPATHHYSATTLATFPVKLAVTDTTGKTSTTVGTVTAAPPATAAFTLPQASRVTVTLISHSCAAQGNELRITSPITQTIFADGCTNAVGVPVAVNGGNVFAANTTLQIAVLSGILPNSTLAFQPAIRVTGDFASGWTVIFDDGYGGPGEPDFDDLVIQIKAAP